MLNYNSIVVEFAIKSLLVISRQKMFVFKNVPFNIAQIPALTLGLLLSFLLESTAFTVGPPPLPQLCKTMNPQHHDYMPQTTESPYKLHVDRTEVGPEQNVQRG